MMIPVPEKWATSPDTRPVKFERHRRHQDTRQSKRYFQDGVVDSRTLVSRRLRFGRHDGHDDMLTALAAIYRI